jgi:hypothetical protein
MFIGWLDRMVISMSAPRTLGQQTENRTRRAGLNLRVQVLDHEKRAITLDDSLFMAGHHFSGMELLC